MSLTRRCLTSARKGRQVLALLAIGQLIGSQAAAARPPAGIRGAETPRHPCHPHPRTGAPIRLSAPSRGDRSDFRGNPMGRTRTRRGSGAGARAA